MKANQLDARRLARMSSERWGQLGGTDLLTTGEWPAAHLVCQDEVIESIHLLAMEKKCAGDITGMLTVISPDAIRADQALVQIEQVRRELEEKSHRYARAVAQLDRRVEVLEKFVRQVLERGDLSLSGTEAALEDPAFEYQDQDRVTRLRQELEESLNRTLGDAFIGIQSRLDYDSDLGGDILVLNVFVRANMDEFKMVRRRALDTFAETLGDRDASRIVVSVRRRG